MALGITAASAIRNEQEFATAISIFGGMQDN